ncbi:MAG: hypothetical protein ACO3C4_01675 [Candidatus Limnocylindrus sp.]
MHSVTQESFWDELYGSIASGDSLRDFCITKDLPFNPLYQMIHGDPDKHESYKLALKARAEKHREQIEKVIDQVEQGQITSDAARVSVTGRQWLASKLNPERYGEKLTAEVKVLDVTQLHLAALKEAMRIDRENAVDAEWIPSKPVLEGSDTEADEIITSDSADAQEALDEQGEQGG